MKLRIVSGTLRGRTVTVPERDRMFRPTRERIRESVAGILNPYIAGAIVADLCAGSGLFGFEMVSRGAKEAVFVELDPFRCKTIRNHAERFNIQSACRVMTQDVRTFIDTCNTRFDIIYFDPPYDDKPLNELVQKLIPLLSDKGILVHERRSRAPRQLNDRSGVVPFFFDCRIYGETEVCFYKKAPPESGENECPNGGDSI